MKVTIAVYQSIRFGYIIIHRADDPPTTANCIRISDWVEVEFPPAEQREAISEVRERMLDGFTRDNEIAAQLAAMELKI